MSFQLNLSWGRSRGKMKTVLYSSIAYNIAILGEGATDIADTEGHQHSCSVVSPAGW